MNNQDDNVVEFKRPTNNLPSIEVGNMTVYKTAEGQYEVFMEVNEDFSDEEVFDAFLACTFKFGIDTETIKDEDDVTDQPDNTDD